MAKQLCSITECQKTGVKNGLCYGHRRRQRLYGDPLYPDQRWKSGRKHGCSYLPIFHMWRMMIARCANPKHKSFKHYGARGIKVCERWLSLENFMRDMGEIPVGMTLERIDSNGNYEPANCRWATHTEQMRNRPSWNKLNMERAREIRAAYASGLVTQRDLAEHYGCDQVLVSKVVLGRNWKEAT